MLGALLGADIIYSSGEARREKETLAPAPAPPILLFGLFFLILEKGDQFMNSNIVHIGSTVCAIRFSSFVMLKFS